MTLETTVGVAEHVKQFATPVTAGVAVFPEAHETQTPEMTTYPAAHPVTVIVVPEIVHALAFAENPVVEARPNPVTQLTHPPLVAAVALYTYPEAHPVEIQLVEL